MTIRFTFNLEKFVNAVAWLANECPDCTKLKICKLLYFADKEHLIQYYRPIIGDTYYKLKNGPIPTIGLALLRGHSSPAFQAFFNEAIEVSGWHVIPKKQPDLGVFSKSDIRVLEKVKNTLGRFSAYDLRDLSHKEPWWGKTGFNERIDFSTLVEGEQDEAKIREFLESEQKTRDALRPYRTVI